VSLLRLGRFGLRFGLLAVFGGRAATWLIAVLTQLAASFGCVDQLGGKAR
jgi:hypothetical protein